MPSSHDTVNPHLETDLWRWLLFDSGLSRRRAKTIILQHAQSSALALFWQAGPEIFIQQLGLTEEEKAIIGRSLAKWPALQSRWETERREGLRTLRISEPGYPPSLSRHLSMEQRPLLLFLRGELTLLDFPFILPIADHPVDESAEAWILETLAELTTEGALALFIARAGIEARLVKAFLDASIPFVLVIPQGLAAYEPPASLQRALDQERALLISPFQPDWRPPATGSNPFLPHAVTFARALASALLTLAPLQTSPFPQQPCFYPPEATAIEHAEPYPGPETLFLRLAERGSMMPDAETNSPTPPAEPELEPISPEEILETLAHGGHIPPALAERIKSKRSTDS